MTRTVALAVLALASPAVLLSFFSESEAALWLVSFFTMAFPIALIALGVSTRGKSRALLGYLLLLALVLELSGFGMLFFSRDPSRTTPWLFGLPPGAILMLGGLWLVPLLIVSWAYPRTFSRVVLDQEDLERIRAAKPRS